MRTFLDRTMTSYLPSATMASVIARPRLAVPPETATTEVMLERVGVITGQMRWRRKSMRRAQVGEDRTWIM